VLHTGSIGLSYWLDWLVISLWLAIRIRGSPRTWPAKELEAQSVQYPGALKIYQDSPVPPPSP